MTPGRATRAAGLLGLLVALLVLAQGIATHIALPGLYFDEVNPDYLVVPLLNPDAQQIPAWLPPGNHLFNRWPLLVQLYHGALSVYLGLPLYAIFGTGAEGVRVAHGFLGATVLVLAWFVMRRAGVPAAIAALASIALALDPAFVIAWRTQYHMLLLPLVPLLSGVLLADRARHLGADRSVLALLIASGLLTGLACYGYFVYFAFAPAVLWFALGASEGRLLRARAIAWLLGFAVGAGPYAWGYWLIFQSQGGWDAGIAWFRQSFAAVNAGFEFGGPLDRLGHFFLRARQMLSAESLALDLFCEPGRRGLGMPIERLATEPPCTPLAQVVPWLKIGLLALLAAPSLAILASKDRGHGYPALLIGLVLGLLALTIALGRRIHPHHLAPLVPLLYVWAALGVAHWTRFRSGAVTAEGVRPTWRRPLALTLIAAFLLVGAINFENRGRVLTTLQRTEGVWLVNASVSRFAESARSDPRPALYMFPDWGFFTGFAMITRGRLPLMDQVVPERARASLCAGQDVVVVTTELGEDSRIAAWSQEIGWSMPVVETVRESSGKALFRVLRWLASERSSGRGDCDA